MTDAASDFRIDSQIRADRLMMKVSMGYFPESILPRQERSHTSGGNAILTIRVEPSV
jgi:hypothetical protein